MIEAGWRPVADTLPRWWAVGFSGHRRLSNPEVVTGKLADVIQQLSRRNQWLVGVASAAAGADTLFGEEILRRRYPMRIVLPCTTSLFKQDFTDATDWARADAIIQRAISVDIVPGRDTRRSVVPVTPESDVDDDRGPDAKYMEAGVLTVDRSDVFVAVWDQLPARGLGGTADIVAYVRSVGLPLVLINPVTGEISEERLDKLSEMTPFRGTSDAISHPRGLVQHHFDALNVQAEDCAPTVRQLVRVAVWLHLIAASVAAAAAIFGGSTRALIAAAVLDVLVLTAAVRLLAIRERRHRQWLQLRTEAEVCRSFLATWDIRRRVRNRCHPQSASLGMAPLIASLQVLNELDHGPSKTLEEVRNDYAQARVEAQICYFERERRIAAAQYKRRRLFTILGTAGALTSSALLALLLFAGWFEQARHWLEFFAIALPLVATACGVLLITDESARRYVSYGEMSAVLKDLLLRVNGSRTWESLGRIAERIEDELLQEVLEWRSFVRHTEHLH